MSTPTTNYSFVKPGDNEYYDINVINENMDIADAELKESEDHRVDTISHIVAAERAAWNNLIVERGTANLTNTKLYPFNDSEKTISLVTARVNLNYIVDVEVAIPSSTIGDIEVYDKQLNGFKIRFTGSVAFKQINYYVSGGMV